MCCVVNLICTVSHATSTAQVAVLCNHQRSVPKGHQTSMAKMDQRMADVEAEIAELKAQLVALQKGTYKAPDGKKAPSIDTYVGW